MFNSSAHGRAVGRIVFGGVLIVGAGVLVERLVHANHAYAATTILATWSIAIVLGLIASAATDVFDRRRSDVQPIFAASFAVPTLGAALVLPLTIHMPFALLFGDGFVDFDAYAHASLYVTAPAHLVFGFLAARRAVQLANGSIAISSNKIFTTTIIAASVPFAVLLLIPPLLVGLTGLAILPILERMPTIIARELAPRVPMAIALTATRKAT